MCCSRSHIHKPCGCTTSDVYICPSFPIQPPPQTIQSTHRRYTTDSAQNPLYTPENLALCRRSFFAFPNVQDPAPCPSHWVLERDVRLVLGPPRAPDGAWDEFDSFAFRRRLREAGDRDGERVGCKDTTAGAHIKSTTSGSPTATNPTSITDRKDNPAIIRQPRPRHLSVPLKEGYESFPILNESDENMEDSDRASEDEKCSYEKICIWPRVFSLGIGGRRGSVV